MRIHWVVGGVLLGVASGTAHAAVGAADVRRDQVVDVVEQVMPSVVNIGTRTRIRRQGYYYDWWRDNWAPFVQELPPQESAGSGLIIDEEGYVITNTHVVEDADEIWVKVSDDSKPEPVRAVPVIGARRTDIAVLKLRAKPGEKFVAAKFGPEDDVLLGESVLALGNPFGLGGSVSRGIISSKPRRTDVKSGERMEVWDWIQTDAAINPGNSGGPLINMRGEVIGMNTAVYRGGQGIGFAIPVKRLAETLSEIFTPEAIKGVWFGAQISPASGLRVMRVQSRSPAGQAGLKEGDRILEVNGEAPRGFIHCNELLMEKTDEPVVLLVERLAERRTIRVRFERFEQVIENRLGLTLEEPGSAAAQPRRSNPGRGLVVVKVESGGPAGRAGVEPGALLTGIGDKDVTDMMDAALAVIGIPDGGEVDLTLAMQGRRGGLVQVWTATVSVKTR